MKQLSDYQALSSEELIDRIQAVRAQAGNRLTILAHYYCMDEVVALADFVGDSLALSQKAAATDNTEAVLFCGVYFMAETADILLNLPKGLAQRDGRRIPVMLADIDAGCPMADMVTAAQAIDCQAQLEQILDFDEFTPITYINSSAATKAFCGDCSGAVCTSANAARILRWAFDRRPRVLFLPDQHLGRNTALAMGIDPKDILVWDPAEPRFGGNTIEAVKNAKVILWKGCCPIHQKFSAELVRQVRANRPEAQIWVHPECPNEIVRQCDGAGSTTKLIQVVNDAPAGAVLAIGTESKLVNRLKNANPDKTFLPLCDVPAFCADMRKNTLANMAWVLENWSNGTPVNVVSVEKDEAASAYQALRQMLDIK